MAIDPNNRPVRVINDDTTNEEFQEGHIIAGANPPRNEEARGGFGNRDGKEGYGTDSAGGMTAVSLNENADDSKRPPDNILSVEEGLQDRLNQDMPAPEDMDPRRVPAPLDEISADDLRKDDMLDPRYRVGMGQMAPPQPNPEAVGANTQTNAEQNDPNAQESGILKGES
ncbi:hypothetical protein LJY25_04445 [Hymenobacter sp. BT175]|uniref:hypothetical protein n=1 Tax=Hymenobacter translucens TaxID=2886507 RepID=UPI001D0DCC81|nr:hypothetical protein [Hymenobacter translucens]MCC2545684.1 hypothetical protein [Hymenobacter translucens]